MENTEKRVFALTKNVIEKNKLLGRNKRNWREAILFTCAILLIVLLIPFTDLVTIIVCVVLCPITFFLALTGIKHFSLTEILEAEKKFRQNRRRLHLRSAEYVRKKNKTAYTDGEEESLAEKTFKYFKQRFDDFVEEYGSEEDSETD